MNKIIDYFQGEIDTIEIKAVEMKTDIHKIELEIEASKNTKNIILKEKSNVCSLFHSGEKIYSDQLKTLEDNEKNLAQKLEERKDSLNQENEKLHTFQNLLDEYENELNNSYKNNIGNLNIIKVQEEERQRIARDIHDSIVQNLTVLIHKSEFALKIADSDILRTKLELEVINKIIRQCINELRDIIYNLRPMSLDDLGFEVTLKRRLAQLAVESNMNINLDIQQIDFSRIDQVILVTIIRMIQELCSNAIKYSSGRNINIKFFAKDKKLYIYFEDDGIGFNENEFNGNIKSGFGIPILKDRIRLLNGNIKFGNNKENKGTRYEINIPI